MINRLPELLVPKDASSALRITAVTRSRALFRVPAEILQEEPVQRIRIERIAAAQDEEVWIRDLKLFLRGDLSCLSADVAMNCGKIEENYVLDDDELLLYSPFQGTTDADREDVVRLVIPESLHQDFLHQ